MPNLDPELDPKPQQIRLMLWQAHGRWYRMLLRPTPEAGRLTIWVEHAQGLRAGDLLFGMPEDRCEWRTVSNDGLLPDTLYEALSSWGFEPQPPAPERPDDV